MKKRLFSFIALSAIALTSCSFFGNQNNYKSYEKEINVYNIDDLDEESNLSSGYQKTINARFIEGEDLIPYLTLKQYASLYDIHLADNAKSAFDKSVFSDIWSITIDDQICFVAQADSSFNDFLIAGSIESAYYEGDDPRDLKALNYGIDIDFDGKYLGDETYAYHPFDGYGIKHFTYERETYYPLGLLDITFYDFSGIYFTYNYKHIISTRDVENYNDIKYIDEGKEYDFNHQMEEVAKNLSTPSYLIKYNAGLFLYLMDNFYGLKEQKGIQSFASYYKRNHGIYSDLFSSFDDVRGMGYSDALSILDDNHTILVSANESWNESQFGLIRRYGERCKNRTKTKSTLQTLRQSAYKNLTPEKDYLLSEDGQTALFSFDSFVFGTTDQVFNDDESIKDTAGNYDTFYKLLFALKDLQNLGTVKNVIFDISLNGGGVVGVMLKVLSLMSKDNSSTFAMYDDSTTQVSIYVPHIDSNNDKKYDSTDSYGNIFNFYLLTSDCSFSCGNALPCCAKEANIAKIIGQKSGGGECAVSVHYLPNSEYVYHSSNLHIGYFDNETNTFEGFEDGVTPDIEVEIGSSFYSVDYLNALIQNA